MYEIRDDGQRTGSGRRGDEGRRRPHQRGRQPVRSIQVGRRRQFAERTHHAAATHRRRLSRPHPKREPRQAPATAAARGRPASAGCAHPEALDAPSTPAGCGGTKPTSAFTSTTSSPRAARSPRRAAVPAARCPSTGGTRYADSAGVPAVTGRSATCRWRWRRPRATARRRRPRTGQPDSSTNSSEPGAISPYRSRNASRSAGPASATVRPAHTPTYRSIRDRSPLSSVLRSSRRHSETKYAQTRKVPRGREQLG